LDKLPAPVAGEMLCLCSAGVRPVKGVVELLAMCDPLVREGRRFRLIFCGPILDDSYGKRFREALVSRPWATYLGILPPAAMPALLRKADLVVSNARSEGLPNALVEAAALGRPILASDIPGNAAVVSHGKNGLLFPDQAGFLTAMRNLLDKPARLRALSRPDPERFAPERESACLERICHNLLAANPGAPRLADVLP
jgi:glycosyltransferase involved in cell wall biosynthesis